MRFRIARSHTRQAACWEQSARFGSCRRATAPTARRFESRLPRPYIRTFWTSRTSQAGDALKLTWREIDAIGGVMTQTLEDEDGKTANVAAVEGGAATTSGGKTIGLADGVPSRRRGDDRLAEGLGGSMQARGTARQTVARLPTHGPRATDTDKKRTITKSSALTCLRSCC